MKENNQSLRTIELIEKSKTLKEEYCALQRTSFDNARLLVELAKRTSDSAACSSTPKSYAPSKLGVPLPLLAVPTTLPEPEETVVIMRIRPAAIASYGRSWRR